MRQKHYFGEICFIPSYPSPCDYVCVKQAFCLYISYEDIVDNQWMGVHEIALCQQRAKGYILDTLHIEDNRMGKGINRINNDKEVNGYRFMRRVIPSEYPEGSVDIPSINISNHTNFRIIKKRDKAIALTERMNDNTINKKNRDRDGEWRERMHNGYRGVDDVELRVLTADSKRNRREREDVSSRHTRDSVDDNDVYTTAETAILKICVDDTEALLGGREESEDSGEDDVIADIDKGELDDSRAMGDIGTGDIFPFLSLMDWQGEGADCVEGVDIALAKCASLSGKYRDSRVQCLDRISQIGQEMTARVRTLQRKRGDR